MKTLLQITTILLISTMTFAQTNWQISGKVIDMDKSAVPFASVFVNNTRIGTSTNENGFFSLTIPARIQQIELVISSVGYNTIKKKFTNKDQQLQNLVIAFESGIQLKEIAITAKRDKEWKRKWKIFERGLMGESDLRSKCRILNPEVVRLEYDKDKNVVATAEKPIIIQNNALGLIISYQIDFFETNGVKTLYSGSKFFKNIDSTNTDLQKRWVKPRKDAYVNTFRNFLVSLSQQKLKENGFTVYKVLVPKTMYFGKTSVTEEILNKSILPCKAEDIFFYDYNTEQFTVYSDKPLMIFTMNKNATVRVFSDFPYMYSIINLPNSYFNFTANGWLSKPNGITIRGFWGDEGFANMLPEDYFIDEDNQQINTLTNDKDIVKQESNSITSNQTAVTAPKSFKPDTLTLKNTATQGIVYDKEAIAQEEKKEFAIVSNDITVKISESDQNLSVFDLLRRIPGLMVTNVQGQYQIHFRSTNTNLGGGGGSLTPALVYDGTFIDDESTVMNILNNLNVRDIKSLGAVKYGNSAAFGARGANGTLVIETNK